MKALESLKPKIKRKAENLIMQCQSAGIKIKITEGMRTIAKQNKLYAQGRTQPGKIVTHAKGGESLHNYGVAFDFCIIKNGKADWDCLAEYKKVGLLGKALGLEWGGSWKYFKDYAHFQYTAGYALKDFKNKRINAALFE